MVPSTALLAEQKPVVNFIIVEKVHQIDEAQRDAIPYSGEALPHYLGELDLDEWVVSINGVLIEKEQYAGAVPGPDDFVVVFPNILGGGNSNSDSKNILRVVLLIVITYVTAGYGAGWAGSLGISSAGGQAAFQAGMMMAGTMAVNAILPPGTPDMSSSDWSESPSYGIDGAKSTSTANIPVPVIYGKWRIAGNVIGLYTENVENTQHLWMLMNAGEGPIAGISDLLINDQPADSFENVEVYTRLGDAGQDYVPGFSQIVTPVTRSVQLTDPADVMTHQTAPCEQVRVDLVMPEGVGYFNSKGRLREKTLGVTINIRSLGDTGIETVDDLPAKTLEYLDANGIDPQHLVDAIRDQQLFGLRPERAESYYHWQDGGQVWHGGTTLWGGNFTITGASRTAVRRSFYSIPLPRGSWEVRVSRTEEGGVSTSNLDAIVVSDINEIQFGGPRYNYTALLGLKIKLDDQLNNIPNVTYLHHGKLIKVYNEANDQWEYAASDNPAWVVYDVLTQRRVHRAIDEDRVDLAQFRRWARYCEQHGLTYNGPIDQSYSVWDACAPILRAGRAQLLRSGTKYTVSIDMPKQPSMMFSVANIKKGSFGVSWLPLEDRANDLEITYYDKAIDYKQRTVSLYDEGAHARGAPMIKGEQTLLGIDNEELALRHARYYLNYNKLSMTCSFEAPLEAIACSIGDLVLVQHDMTKWGVAGLVEATSSSPTTLATDRPVELKSGTSYQARLHVDAIKLRECQITAITGNKVWLNGFNANAERPGRVLRSKTNTQREQGIVDTVTSGVYGHGVEVSDATQFVVGDMTEVWDTDVFLVADITNPHGVTEELTLAAPFTTDGGQVITPAKGQRWMVGEVQKGAKPFVVRSISQTHDHWFQISCLEYDERVYDDEIIDFVPSHSELSPYLSAVTLEDIMENVVPKAGGYVTEVKLTWSHSSEEYLRANVYVAIGDHSDYQLVGTATRTLAFEAEPGDQLRIKIVPVDKEGRSANFDATPLIRYTVVGADPLPPERPINLIVQPGARHAELTWLTPTHNTPGHHNHIGLFEIWHAAWLDGEPEPLFADARLHGTSRHNHYTALALLPDTRQVFWVRQIDLIRPDIRSGVEPSDTHGVMVRTLLDFDIPELFPNGVGSEDLANELSGRIDSLDGPNGLYAKVDDLLTTTGQLIAKTFENADRVEYVDHNAHTAILEERNQRLEDGVAIANMIDGVNARVDDAEAAIINESTARSDGDEAVATQASLLVAQLGDNVNAAIQAEQEARATEDAALANSIDTLAAKVNDDILAAIETEQQARADLEGAIASDITTLTTRLGENEAAVQQQAQSIDGVKAQWTVKLNVNGVFSGFGLIGAPGDETGATLTDFTVMADRFNVLSVGNTPRPVFQVDTRTGESVLSDAVVGRLRSRNYVAGAAGFQLDSVTGGAEFTNITIRDQYGGIMMASGGVVADYINNGQISISPNGSLNGAGGGKVSLGGLGYSGPVDPTRNNIFRQTTQPTYGMGTGDFWLKTNNPVALYQYNGSSWFMVGDRTGQNTAAAIAGQGAFATLNQINSSNISTYIKNLSVDTLQIANQAVTVPGVAKQPNGSISLTQNGWTDALWYTHYSSGSPVMLVFTVEVYKQPDGVHFGKFRLLRDNTTILEVSSAEGIRLAGKESVIMSSCFSDTPSATAHIYKLQLWTNSSGVAARNAVITAIETKK